ncbi:hypothetical protein [Haloterrigena salifodinae]|uniref:hypothetical protein n=1 Tax=Haloterrigena salifodinae TaxID=2675099 RepID=UPI002D21C654|nr:hypothetical protein [Haloterrigena salifodinae]
MSGLEVPLERNDRTGGLRNGRFESSREDESTRGCGRVRPPDRHLGEMSIGGGGAIMGLLETY